jgi:urea carboxylase
MGEIEIINGGFYTTVQDYPGRIGYWNVGIPPSGPMDAFSFRCANWLVGNDPSEAGLEVTTIGPTLRFRQDSVIALCGAEIKAELDGTVVDYWRPVTVSKGSTLTLGKVDGFGVRAYIAFQNGLVIEEYLGSKSTFPKGQFGGHEGRPLRAGDLLTVPDRAVDENRVRTPNRRHVPTLTDRWTIGVIPGPYAAPDYFVESDVRNLFATDYTVHHNSNRLGCRLIGAKPVFARKDGGEGGRHPSNLHDYVYGIGTVNFTGDMPIVIGVDGPSLGGFTSMVTIPDAELWKIGQVKGGDIIQFEEWTVREAVRARSSLNRLFAS